MRLILIHSSQAKMVYMVQANSYINQYPLTGNKPVAVKAISMGQRNTQTFATQKRENNTQISAFLAKMIFSQENVDTNGTHLMSNYWFKKRFFSPFIQQYSTLQFNTQISAHSTFNATLRCLHYNVQCNTQTSTLFISAQDSYFCIILFNGRLRHLHISFLITCFHHYHIANSATESERNKS